MKKSNGRLPLFALEGPDLVGKTTCARAFAEKIGAVYYKNPPSPYSEVKEIIDSLDDLVYRFDFYMRSNLYASGRIQDLLKFKPVVCDRYILTTIAYHEAFGLDLSGIDLKKLRIVLPDFCFLLTATEEICKARANNRKKKSVIDRMMEQDPGLRSRVLENYLKYPVTAVIDTSELSVEEVVCKIISLVK